MAYEGRMYPYVFGQKGMARLTNRLTANPYDLVVAENINFERERLEKEREADTFCVTQDTGKVINAMKMFNPLTVTAGAGTVATTEGDDEVIGTGTSFTTLFQPGDRIVTIHEDLIVNLINSNTSLNAQELSGKTASGLAYSRRASERLIATNHGGRMTKYTFTGGAEGTSAGTAVSVATGLGSSLTMRPKFVVGGQESGALAAKLFYFTGLEVVRVLQAETTFSNLTTPPADWTGVNQPIGGVVHRGRLVGFGNTNSPHRLYFSLATNHEDFTAAGTFQLGIFSNIGQRIYNAVVHNGVLFVWKWPEGLFYLDDTDLSEANWAIRVVSSALGCAPSPHAVLALDDDVMFCDASGHFHLLSAVNTLGGVRASDLTRALGLQEWTRDNINTHVLGTMGSSWDPVSKIAYFTLPSNIDEGGKSSLLVKFDFGLVASGGPVRFSYDNNLFGAWCITRMRENYIGDPGQLVSLGTSVIFFDPNGPTGTINGVGYEARIVLPSNDFADLDPALRTKQKIFDGIELILENIQSTGPTIFVDVAVDGTFRETVSFLPGTTQKQLYKKLSVGAGYTIQIGVRIGTSTLTAPPILGMNIWFRDGTHFHATPN